MFEPLYNGIIPLLSAVLMFSLILGIYRTLFWAVGAITPGRGRGGFRLAINFAMVAGMALAIAAPFVGPSAVMAADGTAGELDIEDISMDGMTVAVKCKGLTKSADFGLWVDTTSTINFTTGASEDTKMFWLELDQPTDKVATVYLTAQTVAPTSSFLDSQDVYLETSDVLVPTDPLVEVFVTIILIVVAVVILRNIAGNIV